MLNQSSPILGCHPPLPGEGMKLDLTATLLIWFLGVMQHISLHRSAREKGRDVDPCSAMREKDSLSTAVAPSVALLWATWSHWSAIDRNTDPLGS